MWHVFLVTSMQSCMSGFTLIEFLLSSMFPTSFFGYLNIMIRGIIDVIRFATGFSYRMLNLNTLIPTRFAANFFLPSPYKGSWHDFPVACLILISLPLSPIRFGAFFFCHLHRMVCGWISQSPAGFHFFTPQQGLRHVFHDTSI